MIATTITLDELKLLCRTHNIVGYSGKRKTQIIKLVESRINELIDNAIRDLKNIS